MYKNSVFQKIATKAIGRKRLILLSIFVYVVAILFLYPIAGSVVAVFSVIPAIVIGYSMGAKEGFAAGLLFLPINWALFRLLGFPLTLIEFTLESSLIGSMAVALVAAGMGYVSTLNKRLEQEVAGREEAQTALNVLNGQLEAQTAQALKARSRFLTAMSHKQRTPLNASMGLSTLLLDTDLDAAQRDYVHDILRSNSESVDIINSILEYTKMESGEVELNVSEFELSTFIQEIVSLGQSRATEQGITIQVDIDSDVPSYVLGDTKKLQLMLGNLLNNALDATYSGQITVSVKLAEEQELNSDTEKSCSKQSTGTQQPTTTNTTISIQVTDTGKGMSSTELANLFQPFASAYASTTKSANSAGIGMALCKSLCNRMNGTIGVESVLHEGTTVTANLPFMYPTIQPETSRSTTVAHRRHIAEHPFEQVTKQSPMKILLAEDNILNAKVALKMLEKLGHTTIWVKDGEEAVSAVAENVYDLVLMDIQMPRLDGLAATQEIRRRFSEQETPFIIALTADTTLEDFSKQKAYGFDGFISKPVSLNILQNALTTVADPQYL